MRQQLRRATRVDTSHWEALVSPLPILNSLSKTQVIASLHTAMFCSPIASFHQIYSYPTQPPQPHNIPLVQATINPRLPWPRSSHRAGHKPFYSSMTSSSSCTTRHPSHTDHVVQVPPLHQTRRVHVISHHHHPSRLLYCPQHTMSRPLLFLSTPSCSTTSPLPFHLPFPNKLSNTNTPCRMLDPSVHTHTRPTKESPPSAIPSHLRPTATLSFRTLRRPHTAPHHSPEHSSLSLCYHIPLPPPCSMLSPHASRLSLSSPVLICSNASRRGSHCILSSTPPTCISTALSTWEPMRVR